MSTWGVVPLAADSWMPRAHLPTLIPKAAPSTYRGPFVPLHELVDFVTPVSRLRTGEPLVTPAGVSPLTGAVQPSDRAALGAVFRLDSDLQTGDVLVPLVGKGPCVLVDRKLTDLAFSQTFLGLRVKGFDPILLWALLSSTSGLEARHRLNAGAVVPRLSAALLADLLVPANWDTRRNLDNLLPEPAVDALAASPLMSHWRLIPMESYGNWTPGRLLDPLEGSAAVPIGALGQVWAGRLDARKYRDVPFSGGTPALRPSDVGRLTTPRWWSNAEARDVAKPESVLLGALSLRAAGSSHPLAVAADILVMDPLPRPPLTAIEVRDRLVAYLSSAAGHKRLRDHLGGQVIPRMTKTSFAEFRVPLPETLPNTQPSSEELLEARLERALWS